MSSHHAFQRQIKVAEAVLLLKVHEQEIVAKGSNTYKHHILVILVFLASISFYLFGTAA